nr:hypothetical protein [Thermococcus celericrescens]
MNRALQRIARGTGIVFAGTVISMPIQSQGGIMTKRLLTIPPELVRGVSHAAQVKERHIVF